ncbi:MULTISPECIES: hypothetical protein [unclassified Rhizobium]|uniref:hypothetical protein n=1 Tax=unclassified Rhizobium TaxID=2613769 RepID=UPI0006F7F57E|nr:MULTISPECIES: hypothetical protein [unclassified Rhizobium]KQV44327.1 hypothetical protein ASC86_06080 [Rhizobium sp. Root1212]KRD38508.1 hypothetical protein ASE37_06080 [Rhizobium sp. Root268]
MRFLLRVASFLALVLGVLAAAVDSIQSVSASQPVLTPLGSAVSASGDRGLALVQSLERPGGPTGVLQPVALWMLQQPAFAVFIALALALWMIAYRKPPVAGRFSA